MDYRKATILLSLFSILFFGCQPKATDTLFTALSSSSTNINFKNTLGESEQFNVLNYGYFYNGGGVAIGDINNDGLPDIYFTGNMKASHLYLNKGNWDFEEIAVNAGVDAAGLWNTGVTMADVNNDGWLDIYVCRSAAKLPLRRKNLLFINNRNNTFAEMAAEYGLDDTGYSTQASFFDYDRDGDLDMYLINHSVQEYAGFNRLLKSNRNKSNPAYADKLYRNDLIHEEKESFGRFTNVSEQAGIKNNVLGFGLGIAVDDLNNDGWPDIYVSNDYNEEDYCYINQQDGTFKESIREYFDHTSLFSMGSDVADINNDGLPEVFTLDMLPEDNFRQKMTSGADNYEKKQALYQAGFHYQSMRNMLHLNNGDGSFSEIGQLAGVSNTDWSWSALFADYDNDGWKDLFVTNGYKSDYTNMDFMAFAADQQVKVQQTGQQAAVGDLLGNIPAIKVPNYIYKNKGDLTFENKTIQWGLSDFRQMSHGAAYADLDNDGDLDLVTNNVNEVASIYRNNAVQKNRYHYLKVRLKDSPLNRMAYGTKVILKNNNRIQSQSLMPSRGFQSAVEPILHFGLGTDSLVQNLIVQWPDGKQQTLQNIKVDQKITISYNPIEAINNLPTGQSGNAITKTANLQFQNLESETILNFRHQENFYNDFKREPLIPHMLSTQGPYLANLPAQYDEVGADINQDGLEDVFIGGAKGQAGQLFVQQATGGFRQMNQQAFQNDASSEDTQSTFFDADGDGDLDLYVCSGGNEAKEGAAEYQDRLYLNNGKGQFTKAPSLPNLNTSSSCVAVADIDQDGDQDLFIGSRGIPGKYPLSSSSYILLNNGKAQFTDATQQYASELQNIGMITDALWSDYDQDNDPDLILVGEYLPLTIFQNQRGKLVTLSEVEGQNSSGWWTSIKAADFDNDGDEDFVLGNWGQNSQMKPSIDQPVSLYAKDFDQNGTIDPILTYYNGEEAWPMPFRDDLVGQLPSLKKEFLFYKDFAKAKVTDLFNAENLAKAKTLKAHTFASSYAENKGDGTFEIKALPTEAQLAPVFAILTEDFNQDGNVDVLLAGNFLETREQFGRYDASKGTLLLGDGKGNFNPVSNREAGIKIKGAVRDLALLKTKQNKTYILVAKNNEAIQVIEQKNQ